MNGSSSFIEIWVFKLTLEQESRREGEKREKERRKSGMQIKRCLRYTVMD
jgi:hypothetical protein